MVNYEEKVFHPNLGICDVTGIDKKEKPAPGRCEKSDGKQRG